MFRARGQTADRRPYKASAVLCGTQILHCGGRYQSRGRDPGIPADRDLARHQLVQSGRRHIDRADQHQMLGMRAVVSWRGLVGPDRAFQKSRCVNHLTQL